MKTDKEYIINLIKKLIEDNRLVKGTVSNPVAKKNSSGKINIKPLIIKDELNIQVEKFNNNKAYHENICVDAFVFEMENYLDEYKQFMISAIGTDYQILKNKKGYNLKESKNSKEEVSLEHNKKKKYIIEEGTPVPFLIKLGVMGENGDVFKNRYDKFRQINKYLEFIDDTINRC